MTFSVLIPARYSSSRFPGKPLIELNGRTMIQRVYERATKSKAAAVYVATDDERIADSVYEIGGKVVMTEANHESGSDRIYEAASTLGLRDDEVVVNVQGDEPLIPPEAIDQVARLVDQKTRMATLMTTLRHAEEVFDPNVVKVVADNSGQALYFSRAPIPWSRDQFQNGDKLLPNTSAWNRHLGIYSYSMSMLREYVNWPIGMFEHIEALEQLRVLANGERIRVEQSTSEIPRGIDTPEDVAHVLKILSEEDK